MEFKVGKKYKIVSAGLARKNGVPVNTVVKVTAVDYEGDAWSNEVYSLGVLGSDREPRGYSEHFTGVPVEKAGWCLANIKRLINGEIVEVEE